MKHLFSQKGMTLPEVLISASIIGGLSLAGLQIFKSMNEAQRSVEANSNVATMVAEMRSILSDTDNCSAAFSGLLPNQLVTSPRDRLMKSVAGTPTPTFKVGDIQPGNITVKSYRLDSTYPGLALPNETTLKISFSRGGNSIKDEITKVIKLNLTLPAVAPFVIQTCSATKAKEEIWKRSTINPDNIHYPNGNVGINQSTPVRPLSLGYRPFASGGIRFNSALNLNPTILESFNTVSSTGWRLFSEGNRDVLIGVRNTDILKPPSFLIFTEAQTMIVGAVGYSVSNKLEVNGGTVVGTGYASTNVAPTNGLLVQGNVGVGTTTPSTKFHVDGSVVSKSGSSSSLDIDFSDNNIHRTAISTNSPSFRLCGLKDGGSYTLVMPSQPLNSTPAFTAFSNSNCTGTLTFDAGTTPLKVGNASMTILAMVRAGNNVYAMWNSGDPAPPTPCSGASKSWVVGGNTCTASVTSGTHGGTRTATASGSPAGSATFTCTSGVWSENPGATCSIPVGCSAVTPQAWTVSSENCSANLASASHGGTSTATDSTNPGRGTATYLCSNGTWTIQGGSTCSTATLLGCPARYGMYGVSPRQECVANGYTNTTAVSTSSTVINGFATGSDRGTTCTQYTIDQTAHGREFAGYHYCPIYYAADDGTAAGICCWDDGSAIPPAGCSSGSVTWMVGGISCYATIPSTPEGSNSPVLTDSAGPDTGTAMFYCSPGGTWMEKAGSTCMTGSGGACASQPVSWGGGNCSGVLNYASDGGTDTATAGGSYSGYAIFQCINGTWSGPTSETCSGGTTTGGPTVCRSTDSPSGGWNFSAGIYNCTGVPPLTNVMDGDSLDVYDMSGLEQGMATWTCSGGTWTGPTSVAGCQEVHPGCNAQAMSWSSTDTGCSNSTAYTPHGSSSTISSTASGRRGSATYSCSDGVWTQTSGTCEAVGQCHYNTELYMGYDSTCSNGVDGYSGSGITSMHTAAECAAVCSGACEPDPGFPGAWFHIKSYCHLYP